MLGIDWYLFFFSEILSRKFDSGLFDFHIKLIMCLLKIFVKESTFVIDTNMGNKKRVINFAVLAKSCKRTPVHTDT